MYRYKHIIGIDPGRNTGACLLRVPMHGGHIIVVDCAISPDNGHGRWAYDIAREWTLGIQNITLAVESQFVPSLSGKNQKYRAHAVDALKTAKHAGGWIYIAQIFGWEIYTDKNGVGVNPSTWRAAMYGWASPPRGVTVDDVALRTVLLRHGLHFSKKHAHIAESILIGEYAANMIRSRGVR